MKVTVLGAGAFGEALGGVLKDNGHQVQFYDPVLELSLEEALEGAETLVLATPSTAIWELLPRLPKDLPLVVATKGLMDPEVFGEFRDWMLLSGPGFAKDIRDKKAVKLTVTDRRVAEWFAADYITFDFTTDRKGVMLCGALKNVYAILAGKSGYEPGSKEMTEFLDETRREMEEVIAANGGEAATADLACGIGDLTLTCAPPSRNFKFGRKLREDPEAKPEETVEGVSALKRIIRGELKVPVDALRLNELLAEAKNWEKAE